MENTELLNDNKPFKRPLSLTILCILSFISSGMGIFSSIMTPMFSDVMVELVKSSPNVDPALMDQTLLVLQAGWVYYFLTFLFASGSLIGAIMMWKLNKKGIHFYSISNLASLFLPTLLLGITISWFSILFTSCFIALYVSNLKHMK